MDFIKYLTFAWADGCKFGFVISVLISALKIQGCKVPLLNKIAIIETRY